MSTPAPEPPPVVSAAVAPTRDTATAAVSAVPLAWAAAADARTGDAAADARWRELFADELKRDAKHQLQVFPPSAAEQKHALPTDLRLVLAIGKALYEVVLPQRLFVDALGAKSRATTIAAPRFDSSPAPLPKLFLTRRLSVHPDSHLPLPLRLLCPPELLRRPDQVSGRNSLVTVDYRSWDVTCYPHGHVQTLHSTPRSAIVSILVPIYDHMRPNPVPPRVFQFTRAAQAPHFDVQALSFEFVMNLQVWQGSANGLVVREQQRTGSHAFEVGQHNVSAYLKALQAAWPKLPLELARIVVGYVHIAPSVMWLVSPLPRLPHTYQHGRRCRVVRHPLAVFSPVLGTGSFSSSREHGKKGTE
jgi:hypothetical protein